VIVSGTAWDLSGKMDDGNAGELRSPDNNDLRMDPEVVIVCG